MAQCEGWERKLPEDGRTGFLVETETGSTITAKKLDHEGHKGNQHKGTRRNTKRIVLYFFVNLLSFVVIIKYGF